MGIAKRLCLTALAMSLSACASMSSDECAVSDWYGVGFTDGSRGLSASQFESYRKDCAAHGVAPDFEQYRSGRNEGLREFCQPERAFNLGSDGRSNPGVCPHDLRDQFAEAYQSGRYLYDLRSSLYQVERRLNMKNQRYLELQAQQHELEAHLVSVEPTMEQRLQMLLELKNLAAEMQQLEEEMLELQEEHEYHQQRVAAYEISLYQST